MKRTERLVVLASLVVTGWALLGTPRTCHPEKGIDAHFDAVGDCGLSGPLDLHREDEVSGARACDDTVEVRGGAALGIPERCRGTGVSIENVNQGNWSLYGPLTQADAGVGVAGGDLSEMTCDATLSDGGGLLLSCVEQVYTFDHDAGVRTSSRIPTCTFTLTR